MNIRFKQILRQFLRLINRLSIVGKLLCSFLLVAAIKIISGWIFQLYKYFTGWINKTLKLITDYIYLHSQTIIFIGVFIGILSFGAGCILCLRQWRKRQSQVDEDLDEDGYFSERNAVNKFRSIHTQGNYNENIYGDFVEIYGNQININNDFSEVAEQIRELVEQLKNQGYSQEDAEEEIANELEEKALENPKVKKTLRRWRKSFSKKKNAASDKEVAQDVVKTATSYSYTFSKDFTEVIGGDFHTLNELLQSKKWEEADWETAKIIYAIGQNQLPDSHHYKKYPPNYIVKEHIQGLPKKYLKNIDKLWHKHSNGRFGFSVQKQVLEGIYKKEDENIGYIDPYDVIEQFGDSVGWRKKDDWLYYVDLYDS